tara:strand:+ start:35 stop:319 length:285 start_codon:yes stop_codon:yes gene_type:complete
MTIKQFIEKAIEGGWEDGDSRSAHHVNDCVVENVNVHKILLDPAAWEAVGKIEKWKEEYERKHWGYPAEWNANMHEMIDALADGKTIQQYIETL